MAYYSLMHSTINILVAVEMFERESSLSLYCRWIPCLARFPWSPLSPQMVANWGLTAARFQGDCSQWETETLLSLNLSHD